MIPVILMLIIRAELPSRLHETTDAGLADIDQTLGNKQRNRITLMTESAHFQLHRVESLSEYLMAEFKIRNNLSSDNRLVIF